MDVRSETVEVEVKRLESDARAAEAQGLQSLGFGPRRAAPRSARRAAPRPRRALSARRRWRGVATVEMAIVLPLLMLIIVGMLEYGWMFMNTHAVSNAAREGARVAARDGSMFQDIVAGVEASLAAAGVNGPFQIEITPTIELDDSEILNAQSGEPVTVRVRLNYNATGDGVSLNMPVPRPAWLESTVTMMREGT